MFSLLEEHRDHLSDFVTRDERGRQLFTYLPRLAAELEQERKSLRENVTLMARGVERVRTIVQLQQSYPKATLLEEECDLAEVVEEAVLLQSGALEQAGVRVMKELEPLPRVKVDRRRLLQILLNLLSNARQAMETSEPGRRALWLHLAQDAQEIRLQVRDTGQGIPPEARGRLFSQGFTTRKDGHGIGLHSSALAVRLMGGRLTLDSDGPGRGATATLVLPAPSRGAEGSSAKRGSRPA